MMRNLRGDKMFGFKKKSPKSEEEMRAESLPKTKKVQFNAIPIEKATQALNNDIRSILELVPVNYYATKNSYLLCVFYYNEDYSEIYLNLEYRVDDLPKGKTPFYKTDKELMRSVLRKFGQNI